MEIIHFEFLASEDEAQENETQPSFKVSPRFLSRL